MRRNAAILFAFTLAALLVAPAARADLFLTLSPTSSTVAVGDDVWVDVVLSQDGAGVQVDANNPLLTAGFLVAFIGSPAAVFQAAFAGPDWISDIAYDLTTSTLTVGLTSIVGVDDLSTPLVLAQLWLKGTAPGTTTLVVSDLDAASLDFTTLGGDVLDPAGAGTALVNVTAVPEPSSLAMAALGLGATALAASRRRGRA